MTPEDFTSLVDGLTAAAAAYYASDALLMSDAEYDAGIEEITALLGEHPDWSSAETNALLGEVAAGQSTGGDVVHPTRMLSMSKVAAGEEGLAEIDDFIAKVAGPVVVEPKMDGLAVRATYRDGNLHLAATRGDGSTGEDITAQARRGIVGLPDWLSEAWTGEVRGEVYMTEQDFEKAQHLRAERGGKAFVNPRNAVAGSLRKTGAEHAMPMHFAAYDLNGTIDDIEDTTLDEGSHLDRMLFARHLGFETANSAPLGLSQTFIDSNAVDAAIRKIEAKRPSLGFDIDGAVIKADRDTDRARLGEGSRTPNWAIAYKYAAEEASAIVEDIEVSVGRTGRIGLRARIAPTFVGGTTVTYATLHNPSWITEQGIGIGSKVVLKRAGDVIPRIEGTLDGNTGITAWAAPATCPQCGEAWNTASLLWRCETPSCGLVNAIDYWCARDCLDIEGVGGVVAEALVASGLVTSVADLYDLSAEKMATLILGESPSGAVRTLGAANAAKIHANIQASKTQPFNRVITGLGIRLTGRTVGRWLAREYGDMATLRAATPDHIAGTHGMGPAKAQAVVDGLGRLSDVIDRLAAAGVNMGEPANPWQDAFSQGLPLAGMTFVISGTIPGETRTTAAEKIEAAGGKASGSVSKTTTALITDETTTSKATKAQALGVRIIAPADFEALLAGDLITDTTAGS